MVTNRDLLVRVLRHPAFLAGDTDTSFFERHGVDALAEPLADKDAHRLSAFAAALAEAARNRAAAKVLAGVPSGWRNLPVHRNASPTTASAARRTSSTDSPVRASSPQASLAST